MKYAADFRRTAREALQGRWGIAVAAGLVAALLGAAEAGGPEININLDSGNVQASLEAAGQTLVTFDSMGPRSGILLAGGAAYLALAALVFGVILFIVGSVVKVGYARFNLDLVDRQQEPALGTLFSSFSRWKTAAGAALLKWLYIFLWSLLLVIPGIVASYSYAMAEYILAEHPELSAGEAIAHSKQLMQGRRGRLFCLHLSFIGWGILAGLTLGIGNLWLTPYRKAAEAAFYREIIGESPREHEQPWEYN